MKNKLNTSLSLRKVLLSALVAAPLATLPAPLWALPSTASTNVTSNSSATQYSAVGTVLQITDLVANRLVLKWNEFGNGTNSIATGDTIIYTLPSSSSAVLNMITGTTPTTVAGTLQSNGSIFILNPNGITLTADAKVTSTGLGLSTVPQDEYYFLANGSLNNSNIAAATTDVTVGAVTGTGINVGTTGNVVLSGRSVAVSGVINAGTLQVNTNNNVGGTGARLGAAGALTLGTAGVAATSTSAAVPGTGTLEVNTNGAAAVLSGASATTVRGGTLTVNTANGAISQGAGQVLIGDGISAGRLNVNAGTGTVVLDNLSAGSGQALQATVTAGATTLRTRHNQDLVMNASTITGNLVLTSDGGNIRSGGDVTVTGGSISLTTSTNNRNITFKGPGDLTFSNLTTNAATGSNVTLTSTTGSVSLPAASIGGNLTVTAATNITQTGAIQIAQGLTNGDTRVAKFEAGGSIALNAANDFQRLQLVNAPNGVAVTDVDDVTIANGTNVIGNTFITAGSVVFGANATDVITFNGDLTINTTGTAGLTGFTIVSGGSGYTTAPTVTIAGTSGATATSSLSLTTGTVSMVTQGAGYAAAPTITITGGGTGATAEPRYLVSQIVSGAAGTGYTAGQTVAVTLSAPATGGVQATATGVANADNTVTVTVTNPGSGYTSIPTVTLAAPTGGTAAQASALAGIQNIVVTAGGTGYTGPLGVTISAPTGPGGIQATASVPTGSVSALTVTNAGTGFSSAPAVTIAAPPSGSTATATGVLNFAGIGGVTDNSNNLTVIGLTQINTLGAVALDGSNNGIGLNHRFGQVNINQGSAAGIRVYELSTLNLGVITSGGLLRAYSAGGDVIDTGPINVVGAEFGAGTAAAPGNITLDNTANNIGGTISLLDEYAVLTGGPAGVVNNGDTVTTYLANNVSIAQAGSLTLGAIETSTSGGLPGTLTLTASGVGSDITFSDQVNVAGMVTLTAQDQVTATSTDSVISNVTVNAGGAVDFRAAGPLTVNATLTENAAGTTASFRSNAALRLGTINSNYTGLVRFQARGNNTIADTVSGLRIFGPVHFESQAGITINRSGHSFGRVSANSTGNNGSVTIVESGGLRLGSISTDGTGNFTATSTTGDIFQDTDQNGIRLGNGTFTNTNTATLNAPNGNVTVDDTIGTGNRIPRLNVTAGANVTIAEVDRALVLGNVTAGGNLTATGGTAGISQLSGARLNVFGTTTFTAVGTGDITIGNTGNRMGGVLATTGSGNITLTENTTLNLKSVATAGTLTARSETGDIIDTADTTVANNRIGGATTTAPLTSASFTAANVVLDLPTSDYGIASFTTTGDARIVDSAGDLILGASSVGGALDVTVLGTGATIRQSGSIKVFGNTTFTALAGGIELGDLTNEFGALRFNVSTGATVAENTSLNLRAGSTSAGPVTLITNSNFVTSGVGASSVSSSLTIRAQGTIIPDTGSLLVTGVFTVDSPALKDLSKLSKSGNLFGRDPVNQGSGPYTPPLE